MKKRALITGIAGQDGPYLAQLLESKGYDVIGLNRQQADLNNVTTLERVIFDNQPDEIYNLAGQSSVRRSFENPEETHQTTGLGAIRLLEATRKYRDATKKEVKFFQASSSEMFGLSPAPANEQTPFCPQSPYGEAKLLAHKEVVRYRNEFGLYACSGILFNHESPRRPISFVTHKITDAVARIKLGMQKNLTVGNIDVARDWGYAPEYMEACYLMMNPPDKSQAEDYVIGTGQAHTIRDFIRESFAVVGIEDYEKYLVIDPTFYRKAEIPLTVANPDKIYRNLGWKAKTPFKELIQILVSSDLKNLSE
jgi:GDPmannose 4,6-dehydratase